MQAQLPSASFQTVAVHHIGQFAEAGQIFFWQGDDCHHVFKLKSGIVRGVVLSEDGDRQVTGFFFAGDQIGLPLTQSYRYSAEAITQVSYVCQALDGWRDALIESCRSDGRMLRTIGAEQDPLYRRGILVSRRNALGRIAAFLVSIVDRLPSRGGILDFPLPQVDIASYLAMTPETVCRSLRKLRDLEIIEMPTHDRLGVTDRALLEHLAHGGPQSEW